MSELRGIPLVVVLVAGTTLAAAGLGYSLSSACASEYDCSKGSEEEHPTVSMTLRHQPGRRVAQGCLLAAGVCSVLGDVGLFLRLHQAVLGRGRGEAGAAPLAVCLNGVSLAAGLSSFPALVVSLAEPATSDRHVDASIAWAALRMIWVLHLLPALWVGTWGSAAWGAFNSVRSGGALLLVGLGAYLCSLAPGGSMPGDLQFMAMFALISWTLFLAPEACQTTWAPPCTFHHTGMHASNDVEPLPPPTRSHKAPRQTNFHSQFHPERDTEEAGPRGAPQSSSTAMGPPASVPSYSRPKTQAHSQSARASTRGSDLPPIRSDTSVKHGSDSRKSSRSSGVSRAGRQ